MKNYIYKSNLSLFLSVIFSVSFILSINFVNIDLNNKTTHSTHIYNNSVTDEELVDEGISMMSNKLGIEENELDPNNLIINASGTSVSSYVDLENDFIYVWGYNGYGSFGVPSEQNSVTEPIPFEPSEFSISDVEKIVFSETSYAVLNDGSVYVWGRNNYGQLGMGIGNSLTKPVEFISPIFSTQEDVEEIHFDESSYAVLNDGSVYLWGRNDNGELGLGDTSNKVVPTKFEPTQFSLDDVSELNIYNSKNQVSYAILNDGSIYVWGNNIHGQLGLGDNDDRTVPDKFEPTEFLVSDISEINFDASSYVILNNGSIYVWGRNDFGQLGLGDTSNKNIPTKFEPTQFSVDDIERISIDWASYVILNDDSVYVWGYNGQGGLGLGDNLSRSVPIKFEPTEFSTTDIDNIYFGRSSYVILNNGETYVWGDGTYGSLGLNTGNTSYSNPTRWYFIDYNNLSIVKNNFYEAEITGYINSIGGGAETIFYNYSASVSEEIFGFLDLNADETGTYPVYNINAVDNYGASHFIGSVEGGYSLDSDYIMEINEFSHENSGYLEFTIKNSRIESKSELIGFTINDVELTLDYSNDPENSDNIIRTSEGANIGSWELLNDGTSYKIYLNFVELLDINIPSSSNDAEEYVVSLLEKISLSYTVLSSGETSEVDNNWIYPVEINYNETDGINILPYLITILSIILFVVIASLSFYFFYYKRKHKIFAK